VDHLDKVDPIGVLFFPYTIHEFYLTIVPDECTGSNGLVHEIFILASFCYTNTQQ